MTDPANVFQVRIDSFPWVDLPLEGVIDVASLAEMVQKKKAKDVLQNILDKEISGTPLVAIRNLKYKFISHDFDVLKVEVTCQKWDVARNRLHGFKSSTYTVSFMD